MQLIKMFGKPINRDIKGVIKVGQDDERSIEQELDEYVVTSELRGYLGDFLEAYKKGILGHTDKIGVWISGFFGSGKSHFLKILSYLLENRVVGDKKPAEYFQDKIADAMVLADMEQTGTISADVILFNIDSKSDADSKNDKEAIVKVFMKVFNEKMGFCGSLPWVADLERQLVKDHTYGEFKAEFAKISGNMWEDAREDFYYEEDAIVEALANTTKMSKEAARNWYSKAEENYILSVEKFAQRVREHIEKQGHNHHVVFLVDEIGQYIGDNSRLMLNLQTVTEDLGTFCGGKAWVIVTSQQDIDSVTKVKGNDFSKIQGRFNTRISLSSANVDEVIKKRILAKNESAQASLKLLYQAKSSILKNLITFSNTAEMKNYTDAEEFISVYPFVPYQFHLLQCVFTGIRIHGASGKHLAEGERSLLSAFQESALLYVDQDMGALIPFAAFYETIEAFLDSNIRTVMIHAKQNSRLTAEDVTLLKLLFLIKYPKEMPANIENLATLMLKHVDEDKLEIKKQIEASLVRLMQETLIQKNGEEYVFLTHDEQDVNKEINSMNIDSAEVIQKVGDLLFEEIYTDKKFRYSNRYHFAFNILVDDRARGLQNEEVGIRVITPYYEGGAEVTQQGYKLMSARENNVIVKLPSDITFLEEIEQALKIQAYLRLKSGSNISQTIEGIKTRKAREAGLRLERARTMLADGLKMAELYVNSQILDIKEKNPVERINDAFRILVDTIYSKLNYVKSFVDSPKELHDLFVNQTVQIALVEDDPNNLAVEEMNSYIERSTNRNQHPTVRKLLNLFSKAPYGWQDLDVSAILLRLFKMQEIRLQYNSEYVQNIDKEMILYLTKRDYTDKVLIKKRERIASQYINNVRTLCKDLFNYMNAPSDEDGLMQRFRELAIVEVGRIDQLLIHYERSAYPGKTVLLKGKRDFQQILEPRDMKAFFEAAYKSKEDLIDYAEDSEEVKNFFINQQKYFDKALEVITIFTKNKTYVLDVQIIQLITEIHTIVEKQSPYSDIPKLPGLVDDFLQQFLKLLETECAPIKQIIEDDLQQVKTELEQFEFQFLLLPKINSAFHDLVTRLHAADNFYEVIAMKVESDRLKLKFFEEINQEIDKQKQAEVVIKKTGSEDENKKTYVTRKMVHVSINHILQGTKTIENQEDIEALLAEIKQRLEAELKENTIVRLV